MWILRYDAFSFVDSMEHLDSKVFELEDLPVDGETAVIVTKDNLFFSHWACKFAPKWDGDDDSFETVPEWTADYRYAKTFDNSKAARRFLNRNKSKFSWYKCEVAC